MADLVRRQPETITAAAAQLAPIDARVTTEKPTQGQIGVPSKDLWHYYESMPAPNWFVRFVSNQMRLVRFYAAKVDPEVDEPVRVGTVDDATGERTYDPAEQQAVDAVRQIRSRGGEQGSLIQATVEHLVIDGRSLMVGVPRDEIEDPIDTDRDNDQVEDRIDPIVDMALEGAKSDDDILWFEAHSFDSRRVNTVGNQIVVERAEQVAGGWKPMSPNTSATMVWMRHPRHGTLVESPFRAAYTALSQLDKLNDLMDTVIESRMLGRGILLVPSNAEPPIPEWLEGYGPAGSGFFDKLLAAMSQAINDRRMQSAVTPVAVKVPPDAIELFRHMEFPLTIDDFFETLRARLHDDLAEAWNVPSSQLSEEGIQDLNHWSQWAELESTVRTTWKPMAETIAAAWTEFILHTVLRDAGVDNWHEYVVWYDLSALTQRPERTDEAVSLWEHGLLSDEAAMEASGFPEGAKPSPEEFERRLLQDLVATTPSAAPVLFEYLEMNETAAKLRDLDIGAAPEVPAPVEGPEGDDAGDRDPPDTDPTEMTASGRSSHGHGGWPDAVSEAIRWAVLSERGRTGSRIRGLVNGQLKDVLDGVVPWDVASTLGPTVIEKSLTLPSLLQPNAFVELRQRAVVAGVDPDRVVDRAEAIFAATLYQPWQALDSHSLT